MAVKQRVNGSVQPTTSRPSSRSLPTRTRRRVRRCCCGRSAPGGWCSSPSRWTRGSSRTANGPGTTTGSTRRSASPEEKLRALEKIVAHATGRNIVFEKRTVEREVAIAQGYWAMRDPQQNARVELLNLRRREDDRNRLHFGGGDINAFLRHVENETRMRVIDCTTRPPPRKIIWHDGFDREVILKKPTSQVDQFFLSIASQTLLSFEIDAARIEVWFVREDASTTRPTGAP